MEEKKIDYFVAAEGKFYPVSKMMFIKDKLKSLPDEREMAIQAVEKKDPTTLLIVSVLAGGLGVDRFMLGDTGMGLLKLLTGGCCGILWLIDIFNIQEKARMYNYNQLMMLL